MEIKNLSLNELFRYFLLGGILAFSLYLIDKPAALCLAKDLGSSSFIAILVVGAIVYMLYRGFVLPGLVWLQRETGGYPLAEELEALAKAHHYRSFNVRDADRMESLILERIGAFDEPLKRFAAEIHLSYMAGITLCLEGSYYWWRFPPTAVVRCVFGLGVLLTCAGFAQHRRIKHVCLMRIRIYGTPDSDKDWKTLFKTMVQG